MENAKSVAQGSELDIRPKYYEVDGALQQTQTGLGCWPFSPFRWRSLRWGLRYSSACSRLR